MDFLDLARQRYSCRKYKPDSVDRGKIEYILEAGRVAPSAVNRQPWMIYVVTERELLEQVWETYYKNWIQSAPVILVLCGDHSVSWKRQDGKDHCDIDVAILADHITLAAAEQGLATCWVCHFDHLKCAGLLGLPGHMETIALLPLGYPDDQVDTGRHGRLRKPLSDIVRWK